MYKKLFNHIKKNSSNFTEEEFNKLLRFFEIKKIEKKSIFLKEGTVCKSAAYLVEGCFRYYTVNSEGGEFITRFAFEDYWIGDVQSMTHGTPSRISIEALEDCSVLEITASDYNFLLETSRPFADFTEKMRAKAYQSAELRSSEFTESAESRYKILMSKYPNVTQRIPQYHIASYLGITPESLSRLRKKMIS